ASPKSASRSSRPGTVTRCEAEVISDCIIRGRQREACQRCLTETFSPQVCKELGPSNGFRPLRGPSPSVSDRYETQRPAANPRGPQRPDPVASAAMRRGFYEPAAVLMRVVMNSYWAVSWKDVP